MAKCRTSSSIVALCISIGVGLKRNQGNSRPLQPLLSDCGVIGGPEKNDFLLMTLADPRPDPLDMLRVKQEYEVLRRAIDSLPWLLKEGFQMRLNEDLSLNEIAAAYISPCLPPRPAY
jgi:DNA-directed RNA polymerase specialized sigma24 family protein